MARVSWCVGLLVTMAGLPACKDESTAPAGTPSAVSVAVYVDADGSLSLNLGDVPVAGELVRLTPAAGGSPLEATTAASGVASFAAVPPGGYVASFAGASPAGAILATASQVAVTAPFRGADVTAEFRFVYLPGFIAGQIFRDDNTNGTYEPGVDTPGAGMSIALFAGSMVSADTLATTVTGADGRFGFERLRVGPHTISIRPPSALLQIVGDTIQTLAVPPADTAAVSVQFTGTLVVPIAQAKQDSGNIVTIEGVVTVAQGVYRTQNDNAYMQDTSAGIQVFNLDPALGLQLGDSVRVTGRMGAFAGEFEIVRIDPGTLPTVVALGSGTVPSPRHVTGAEVAARTYEGSLVTVLNAKLTAAPGGTTGGYNLVFVDAVGDTFTVRIETGVSTAVPRSFWTADAAYNVTGALGSFNGTAQLKPRAPADILGTVSIAAAKQDSGNVVLIAGVVTVAQGTFRTDNAYLQDTSSGVQLFNLPTGLGLAVSDSVRITGIMGAFAGEREIVRFSTTSPPVAANLGPGTPITPRAVTGADIVARTYEGELVTIANVTLTSTIPGGTTGYNLTFQDGAGTSFTLRIETPVVASVPRTFWTQNQTYASITGVLGSFNGTAQLKPRGSGDIVP
jgi:hypothetical protein